VNGNATEKWSALPRRRIYLMRHGEVDYFDAEGKPFRPQLVPLNEEGRRQAEAAARELAAVPLDRVITSGLRRSVETAERVVAGRGLVLESVPELREIEPGRLRDLAPAEVERAFLGGLDAGLDPATRFLGGETFGALGERVGPCFDRILVEPGWRHLLIVAHGVVNRTLLCRVLRAGLAGLGGLEQDAGCINVLDVDDAGRCLVRLVNHTPGNAMKLGMELTTLERLYLQYLRRGAASESQTKTSRGRQPPDGVAESGG
jgi:probable phosphoglycerate mutase